MIAVHHASPCSNDKSLMGNLKVEVLELTQRAQTMVLASPLYGSDRLADKRLL
jgi:hypothetical protein